MDEWLKIISRLRFDTKKKQMKSQSYLNEVWIGLEETQLACS